METTTRESDDPYYDLIEDFDLIISSFQTQYGIRLSRELRSMKWDEFRDLLSGLGPDTPLGRVVSIRAEEDEDILKHFTKEQHRIRNAWRQKKVKQVSQKELDSVLNELKNAFISMAGGEKN